MSSKLNSSGSSNTPYYVAHYKSRTVAIKRDPDYQATIKLLQKSISKLRAADPQDIVIATVLADYGDELIQISEEIWPDVVGEVKAVEVVLDSSSSDQIASGSNTTEARNTSLLQRITQAATSTPSTGLEHHIFTATRDRQIFPRKNGPVLIRAPSQNVLTFNNLSMSTATVRDFKRLMEASYRIPAALQRLEILGKQLDDDTFEKSGVANIPVNWVLNTRKSIIYLLPSYQYYSNGYNSSYKLVPLQNLTIQFDLNRNWELTALWPHMDDSSANHYAQSRIWTVDVPDERILTDRESESEVHWLYWDGSPSSNDLVMTQNEATHFSGTAESLQSMVVLKPNNSVAVPFKQAESYVTSVLHSFQVYRTNILSVLEAQMSLKPCSHFAIRFLPQAEYQAVSQLSVHDHPNADILRLVMLYKRLDAPTAAYWDSTRPNWSEGAAIWAKIIGGKAIVGDSSRKEVAAVEFTHMEVP